MRDSIFPLWKADIHCGLCHKRICYVSRRKIKVKSCKSNLHNRQFNRVAIPYSLWRAPNESLPEATLRPLRNGTCYILWLLENVQELLIVVGQYENLEDERIVLRAPALRPSQMFGSSYDSLKVSSPFGPTNLKISNTKAAFAESWALMGSCMKQMLDLFKVERTKSIQFEINGTLCLSRAHAVQY